MGEMVLVEHVGGGEGFYRLISNFVGGISFARCYKYGMCAGEETPEILVYWHW